MTEPDAPHVVWTGPAWSCLHCGDSYAMPLPCRVTVYTAALTAFIDEHRDCQPRETP